MIKIHGTSMSRTGRCLWALEELGVKYDHVPTPIGNARTPDHMKINPNGHIPALEDGPMQLWESMAINLYLAEKYGKAPLWPGGAEAHAACYQWSFWAMTEVEPHMVTLLFNRLFAPPDKRDEKAVSQATETLKAPMRVLDQHLEGRDYLLSKDFTIADLNVASVVNIGSMVGFDLSATPTAQKWLNRCVARESNQRASTGKA